MSRHAEAGGGDQWKNKIVTYYLAPKFETIYVKIISWTNFPSN